MQDKFRQVEDEYFVLRGQLDAGRVTREQFEARLQELMFQDAQGHYWMIGADSGKWYTHNGQAWVETNPPGASVPPAAPLAAPFSIPPLPVATLPAVPPAPEKRASTPMPFVFIALVILVCLVLGAGGVYYGITQGWIKLTNEPAAQATFANPSFQLTATAIALASRAPIASTTATLPNTIPVTVAPSQTPIIIIVTTVPQAPTATATRTATNPPPSPTATPTTIPATPTSTSIPPSPTTSFPPSVYVTNIRLDPAEPKRNQGVTFIATFVNTTGTAQNYSWLVLIFDANTNKGFGETTLRSITIPPGTTEIATENNWSVKGSGGCLPYYARAHYRSSDNSRPAFSSTDGTVVSKGFQVCP